MKPIELKNGIYWVGAIDWSIRDFHGYETPRGTTYNNYLILDNEITLVDTVKHDFSEHAVMLGITFHTGLAGAARAARVADYLGVISSLDGF